MRSFKDIRRRAEERKGGAKNLAEALQPLQTQNIADLGDDRLLSEFSKRVFQAGFNWRVVENKWPGFEKAFHGFDIGKNAMMSEEDLDRLLKDTSIVRHAAKILSVRDNAIFLSDLAQENGSAARFFAEWPSDNLVGLWEVMKKRGNRLGGTTGQYALRFLGKDCFILSRSVTAALQYEGVIDGPSSSKTARGKIQQAFNHWQAESGESLTDISRILAYSVPD